MNIDTAYKRYSTCSIGLFSDLRNNPNHKITPITDAKLASAAEMNLTIIGQPTAEYKNNTKYLLYRFNTCGHTQNIDTNLVRTAQFKCRQCEHDRLKDTADLQGLILLERAHKGTNALYRFKSCLHEQRIGYDAVSKGLFRCRECYYSGESLVDKYRREAERLGLRFISKLANNRGLYSHSVCNHEFEHHISALRSLWKSNKNIMTCPVCFNDRKQEKLKISDSTEVRYINAGRYIFKRNSCGHEYISSYSALSETTSCAHCNNDRIHKEATDAGLEIIEPAGKGTYLYKLPCGHTKNISPFTVRTAGWRCAECYDEAIKVKGESYDLKYMGPSEKGSRFRLFSFNSCGHVRDVSVDGLIGRNYVPTCIACKSDKHKVEAETNGLQLIGAASNSDPNYRRYRTSCCNTEHDFMVTHVRRNSFICPSCGDSHLENESTIYLYRMQFENKSWLKLGYSQNASRRLIQYQLLDGVQSELVKSIKLETGRKALYLEKMLHRKYKDYKLDPNNMKKYFLLSGFNECYPDSLELTLLKEMEDIANEKRD